MSKPLIPIDPEVMNAHLEALEARLVEVEAERDDLITSRGLHVHAAAEWKERAERAETRIEQLEKLYADMATQRDMAIDDLEDSRNERARAWAIADHFANELIDHWHDSAKPEEFDLHEFMGLTVAAYARFVGLGIRSLSVPREKTK